MPPRPMPPWLPHRRKAKHASRSRLPSCSTCFRTLGTGCSHMPSRPLRLRTWSLWGDKPHILSCWILEL